MKNALSRTLVDPRLADAEVIPTSTMQLPATESVVPTQDLVNDALSHRAELAEARINLANTEISNKAVRNSLLPSPRSLRLLRRIGLAAEMWLSRLALRPAALSMSCFDPTRAAPPFRNGGPVSYGTSLNQTGRFERSRQGSGPEPDHSASQSSGPGYANPVGTGISPIADAPAAVGKPGPHRSAAARSSPFTQNRASVASAQAAVDLGHQSLDAEQKKYALGLRRPPWCCRTRASWRKPSRRWFLPWRLTKSPGRTGPGDRALLDHSGIMIADAERGEVTHMPTIPFVTPRKDIPGSVMQPRTPPRRATGADSAAVVGWITDVGAGALTCPAE